MCRRFESSFLLATPPPIWPTLLFIFFRNQHFFENIVPIQYRIRKKRKKSFVYNSRKHEKISLKNLITNVTKVKNIEKEIAGNNEKKVMLYNKKWKKIESKLNEKCQSH